MAGVASRCRVRAADAQLCDVVTNKMAGQRAGSQIAQAVGQTDRRVSPCGAAAAPRVLSRPVWR